MATLSFFKVSKAELWKTGGGGDKSKVNLKCHMITINYIYNYNIYTSNKGVITLYQGYQIAHRLASTAVQLQLMSWQEQIQYQYQLI